LGEIFKKNTVADAAKIPKAVIGGNENKES